jgi:hypothetical protein
MKTLRLGLMFWAAAALAQFPFPGGYPGGGYPYPGGGYPYPGGGYPGGQQPQQTQDSSRSSRATSSGTNGMVRRASGNQLVIQTDDHRVVWFHINIRTEGDKNGDKVDVGSFAPGDHVSVEYTEDDNGYYTADRVDWTRAGTPQEQETARQTWDLIGVDGSGPSDSGGSGRRTSGNVDGDDDRPILRRHNSDDAAAPANAPGASAQSPQAPQYPQPSAQYPQPGGQPTQAAAQDSTDTPVIRATQDTPAAAPPDADDPGRPVLRRGGAATAHVPDPGDTTQPSASVAPAGAAASNAPATVAANSRAPQASNPPLTGVKSTTQSASAPAPQRGVPFQDDPLIAKAREAAYNFSESLPNFFCKQMTTRYHSENSGKAWNASDIVSADVAYEGGHESYKNIKVGNSSTNKSMEQIGGTVSTGEFSSWLEDLMSDSTAAVFRRGAADTIQGRSAIVFSLDVPRERSHWLVKAPSELYYPAYHGSVWIDKATGRVLRIEVQARNVPGAFPFDTIEMAIDYDYIRLAAGEQAYLLPSDAEALSCDRGTSDCARNRIEFRNYRKFEASSTIDFN